LTKKPESESSELMTQAALQFEEFNLKESAVLYTHILMINSNHADAHFNLGAVLQVGPPPLLFMSILHTSFSLELSPTTQNWFWPH